MFLYISWWIICHRWKHFRIVPNSLKTFRQCFVILIVKTFWMRNPSTFLGHSRVSWFDKYFLFCYLHYRNVVRWDFLWSVHAFKVRVLIQRTCGKYMIDAENFLLEILRTSWRCFRNGNSVRIACNTFNFIVESEMKNWGKFKQNNTMWKLLKNAIISLELVGDPWCQPSGHGQWLRPSWSLQHWQPRKEVIKFKTKNRI